MIETDGVVIRGRTTIPDTFTVSIVRGDEGTMAVWPDVAGQGGYGVNASGDEIFAPVFQTDTTFRLQQGSASVTVRAINAEAFRYFTHDDVRRAGIEGASGVFGAIQIARRQPRPRAGPATGTPRPIGTVVQ